MVAKPRQGSTPPFQGTRHKFVDSTSDLDPVKARKQPLIREVAVLAQLHEVFRASGNPSFNNQHKLKGAQTMKCKL